MLHLLIIGAGTMGKTHWEAYREMEDVHIVGIVEKSGQAAEWDCPVFFSFEEALMAADRIDVVDICVPTPLHMEFVKKAADAKLSIICEKPLARSLEEGREMIRYCEQRNVRLFVAHVLRFFPEYEKAKEILDSDTIGTVCVARATRAGRFPQGWNDWYADFNSSGGLVLDMVIHDIDFLRWCFGDVERVYAKGTHGKGIEKLEYALITLRFKSGVIAHVEGSWAHENFSMKLELAGTQGVIEYDSTKDKPIEAGIRTNANAAGGVPVPESPLKTTPYYRELRHFLHCIKSGETPKVTAWDAWEALKISLAAIESIRTNKPVTIH